MLDLELRNARVRTVDDRHPRASDIFAGRILGLDDMVEDLPARTTVDFRANLNQSWSTASRSPPSRHQPAADSRQSPGMSGTTGPTLPTPTVSPWVSSAATLPLTSST